MHHLPCCRFALLLAAALTTSSASSAGGMPCATIDYAQLKDSSKGELIDAYCSASSRAQLNKDLRDVSLQLAEQQQGLGLSSSEATREASERGNAQVACLRVAESASAMLRKKFASKAPPRCS
jgi:hypothetical protein